MIVNVRYDFKSNQHVSVEVEFECVVKRVGLPPSQERYFEVHAIYVNGEEVVGEIGDHWLKNVTRSCLEERAWRAFLECLEPDGMTAAKAEREGA